MKLHWKLVLIPCLSLAIVLLTLAWRTEQLILNDKTQFSLDAAEKQLNPLKRVISDRVASALITLQRAALSKEAAEGTATLPFFGDFQAISLFAVDESNRWSPQWTLKEKSSRALKWPEGLIKKFGESLPFAKVKKNEVYWERVATSPADSYFMLATRSTIKIQRQLSPGQGEDMESLPEQAMSESREVIMLGVFKKNWIQDFVNDYRGSYEEVVVFNEVGRAQAHTSISLIGKDLSASKIVKDSIANKSLNQPREYSDEKGDRFFGITDRIPLTNLYTSIALPREFIFRVNNAYRETLFAVGTGALIIVFIFVFLIGQNFSMRAKALTRFVGELAEGNYDLQLIPKSKDELGLLGVAIAKLQSVLVTQKNRGPSTDDYQSERMAAYSQLGKGIVGTIKEPLMTILGHAQMARSKAPDETKDHYVVIEREVRRAKSIIEKLGRFVGLDQVEHTELNLGPILNSTLQNLSSEMEEHGVSLLKSINEVEAIVGHENQVRTIINSVCMNAAEAMKVSETKEIRVGLSQRDSYIRLSFEDTGPGMSEEDKARLFEPFYSKKEEDENLGLGMALVLGIVNEHGAKISVHSEQGQGTQIFIDFPSATMKNSVAPSVLNHNLDMPAKDFPKELSGAQALDGQDAEQLPVAPEVDEITFVGEEQSFVEAPNEEVDSLEGASEAREENDSAEPQGESNIVQFENYSKPATGNEGEEKVELELEDDERPTNLELEPSEIPEESLEALEAEELQEDSLGEEQSEDDDEGVGEGERAGERKGETEELESISLEDIPSESIEESDLESEEQFEAHAENPDPEPIEEQTIEQNEAQGSEGADPLSEESEIFTVSVERSEVGPESSPIHQLEQIDEMVEGDSDFVSPSLKKFEDEIEEALERGGTAEFEINESEPTSDHIETDISDLDELESQESSSTIVASSSILEQLNRKVAEPPRVDEVSDEESDPFYPSSPSISLDELNDIEDRSHLPKKPSSPPKSYLQENEKKEEVSLSEADGDQVEDKEESAETLAQEERLTRSQLKSRRNSKLKVRRPKRK